LSQGHVLLKLKFPSFSAAYYNQ